MILPYLASTIYHALQLSRLKSHFRIIDHSLIDLLIAGIYAPFTIAGGICYTVVVAFFATDGRFRYSHFIWHLFVPGGTVYHYFAVWHAI